MRARIHWCGHRKICWNFIIPQWVGTVIFFLMFLRTKEGLLNEKDVESLMAFRELREKEFANELAKDRKVTASDERGKEYQASNVNDGNPGTFWALKDYQTTGYLEINLGAETAINRILLQEYIKLGQRVQEFKVEAFSEGGWKDIVEGTTIGHKVIRKFPTINASKIRVNILKSKACPLISNVELYNAIGE